MTTIDLHAPNISCAHCKASIEAELRDEPGLLGVVVDVETKQVHIEFEDHVTGADALRAKLAEVGYPTT